MHVVVEYLTLQWGVEHLTDKILQKIKTHENLWELNPLDLTYQAKSLPKTELLLLIFQNGQSGQTRTGVILHPKWSGEPTPQRSGEIIKTHLTFEFKRFGFKFAVCVFQIVDLS